MIRPPSPQHCVPEFAGVYPLDPGLGLVFKSPVRSGFSAKFRRNRNRTGCLLSRFMGNRQPVQIYLYYVQS